MRPLTSEAPMTAFGRPNWVEVDLAAIGHNVGALRRQVGADTRIFTALKANAYGFGLLPVAETVARAGAGGLAVVDLGDAVRIREHGVDVPILLFGGTLATPESVAATARFDLIASLCNRESAEAFGRWAPTPVQVFVELNTGGERLGVAPEEAVEFVGWLRQFSNLRVEGIYTHPGVPAKGRAVDCVEWQYRRFARAVAKLDQAGLRIPVRMAASSKILRMTDRMTLNGVDPGNLVYGLDPGGPGDHDLGVRPALVGLKSRLVHIHAVQRTEFLDEAPIPVRPGLRVGVIPMGASDRLGDLTTGEVLVGGRRAAILGKLSAEHAKLDLTEVPAAQVGDEVVIIGRQGDDAIQVDDVARHRGVDQATVVQALPVNVRRLYTGG